MTQQQRVPDHQTAMGFYHVGREFLEAFTVLNEARPDVLDLTSVKLQMLCQATELILKGWLALKGYNMDQWYTHDLEKVYEKVLEEYGVSKYLDGDPTNILYLNQFYSIHGYRYPLERAQHLGMLNAKGLKQLEKMVTNLKDGLIIKIQQVRLRPTDESGRN